MTPYNPVVHRRVIEIHSLLQRENISAFFNICFLLVASLVYSSTLKQQALPRLTSRLHGVTAQETVHFSSTAADPKSDLDVTYTACSVTRFSSAGLSFQSHSRHGRCTYIQVLFVLCAISNEISIDLSYIQRGVPIACKIHILLS